MSSHATGILKIWLHRVVFDKQDILYLGVDGHLSKRCKLKVSRNLFTCQNQTNM